MVAANAATADIETHIFNELFYAVIRVLIFFFALCRFTFRCFHIYWRNLGINCIQFVRCCNMTISSDWRTHSPAHRSYACAVYNDIIIIIHNILVLHVANGTKYSFIKRIVGIEVIFEWKMLISAGYAKAKIGCEQQQHAMEKHL